MTSLLSGCARAAGLRAGTAHRRLAGLGACLVALGLAGCGGTTSSGNAGVTVSGSTLTIVVARPAAGAGQVGADVFDAERLAFEQSGAKAGPFHLALETVGGDEASANARAAVSTKTAVAYLGEIQPGGSGDSVQITNELGLLQVSPTDTANYLTRATPGVKNSPQHFYPEQSTFKRTFGRVVPTTAAEATALVARMKSTGVTSFDVEDDGSQYGTSVALELVSAASKAGLTAKTVPAGSTVSAPALAYAGLPGIPAHQALDAAVAHSPSLKLFAPSGLYNDLFVSDLSSAAQHALTVSAPGFLTRSLPPVGQAFQRTFTTDFHHAPAPQAIFGYEAMRAVIATLDEAGAHAAVRATVVSDFEDLHRSATQSAVGAYALNNGDTNIAPFVFARVAHGALTPVAAG